MRYTMKDSSWSSSRLRQHKQRRRGAPWRAPIWAQRAVPLQIFCAVFCVLFSIPAHARIYIQIDQPSEKKFPIAVVDLVSTGGGENKDWSKKTADIIRKDLGLTGIFDLVSPEDFPNSAGARSINPSTIQFPPWTLIGAQALVNGGYSKGKDGVQVELHLYDPFLGQHLLSRTYTAKPGEMAVVAHHFADEI